MKQEASNSTESHEYGSLSIEFVDDQAHVDEPEEDPEEEVFPEENLVDDLDLIPEEDLEEPMEEEPRVVYSDSGPKSIPSSPDESQHLEEEVNQPNPDESQHLEEEVDQPYSAAMAEKIVEFDADKTARINNIKIINSIIANYVESITDKESAEFYVNVMWKYRAAVRARGTFVMMDYWVDAVRKTTQFMKKKGRFYRKLRRAIIDYCCSDL